MQINKKWITSTILCLIFLSAHVLGQDAFYDKTANFVESSILPWTRLSGVLIIIGGFVGVGLNRHENEKMSGFFRVIATGAAIFAIPEIINWLWGYFGEGSLDVL